MAPPSLRKQTPLRSVPWLSLLREARQFPILRSLQILLARRVSFAQPIPPARRETFRRARAFQGSRANPLARFLAVRGSLSGTARLFLRFSSALLQTIFRKPAPAVRPKQFSRVPFREVLPGLPEFLFPSNPSAPQSSRGPVPAERAASSPPEFLHGCRAPAFPETRRAPYRAASDAAPAGRAQRPLQSSLPEKIAAR